MVITPSPRRELDIVARSVQTVQFRCLKCGYGISLRGELPACPMCQRRAWQRLPRSRALMHSPGPDEFTQGKTRRLQRVP